MLQTDMRPMDMRVLSEQIYQYKKGERSKALCTFPERYLPQAIARQERQGIDYVVQPIGNSRINVFFGRGECMDAIRLVVKRPLN